MAQDKSKLPQNVREILAYMPSEMQRRVLDEYDHYAPFLMMLGGWKEAVSRHYQYGERAALARLQAELFPRESWRFPAQCLAVPREPPSLTTEITFGGRLFQDPAKRPWMPCGPAWLLPTHCTRIRIEVDAAEHEAILVVEAARVGNEPWSSLLERGQLAFAAASESVVVALAAAEWWAQMPDKTVRPLRLTRYAPAMQFERELHAASQCQHHLARWLPACYPYSRKILHWNLFEAGQEPHRTPPPIPDLSVPGDRLRYIGQLKALSPDVMAALQDLQRQVQADEGRAETLFHFNAVPVVQTDLTENTMHSVYPHVGQWSVLRPKGVPHLLAAVVYRGPEQHTGNLEPASMRRVPSADPTAKEEDVEIQYAPYAGKMHVKLYHGASGEENRNGSDTPSSLERPPVFFNVPFPVIGGGSLNAPPDALSAPLDAPADSAENWTRIHWYHTLLRPPLLTEGDVIEIIRQRGQGMLRNRLTFDHVTREILRHKETEERHWRSYLWPSVVPREGSFDMKDPEAFQADHTPLIQCLRLTFKSAPDADSPLFASAQDVVRIPAFLLSDMAHYFASVVSQHFVLSCFRVEGSLRRDAGGERRETN